MSRQRSRRVNYDGDVSKTAREEATTEHFKEADKRVMFMEEVDYKMEIEEEEEPKNRVILKNQAFSE